MDVSDAEKGHRMTTLATMLEKRCQDVTLQSWKENEMRCLRCRAPVLTDHTATFGDTDGSYDRNKWLVDNCFKDNAGVNLLVNCGYKGFLNFSMSSSLTPIFASSRRCVLIRRVHKNARSVVMMMLWQPQRLCLRSRLCRHLSFH